MTGGERDATTVLEAYARNYVELRNDEARAKLGRVLDEVDERIALTGQRLRVAAETLASEACTTSMWIRERSSP
jgi:hypothetical protein